ncbi:MAG: hypothetical protein E6R03_10455 [Hyphomicrobiaceae bacterium]|nr:MAG: hypothetical protein E6R03_10455 [Hyphomicrobiaceae bacterium]
MSDEYSESEDGSVSGSDDVTASQVGAGEAQTVPDDPLDVFTWKLNYRPVSAFANGHYEARVIIGENTVIRSGTTAAEVIGLIREQAAKALEKIES